MKLLIRTLKQKKNIDSSDLKFFAFIAALKPRV